MNERQTKDKINKPGMSTEEIGKVTKRKYKLIRELIALSIEKNWPAVLDEWRLELIEQLEKDMESETCLCGHYPIREVCHIVNVKNENNTIVGNCCVKKFTKGSGFDGTHKVFDSLRRLQKGIKKSANLELLKYARNHDILGEKDYAFYQSIWRKRNLSDRQKQWKRDLNERMLNRILPNRVQQPSSPLKVVPQSCRTYTFEFSDDDSS